MATKLNGLASMDDIIARFDPQPAPVEPKAIQPRIIRAVVTAKKEKKQIINAVVTAKKRKTETITATVKSVNKGAGTGLMIMVPEKTLTAIKVRAAEDGSTVRALVLAALHKSGYPVPADELTDRRRPRD